MKRKTISLAVLSLGLCTLAIAAEYNTPAVGFKVTAPSPKETKVAEFNEEYKVEGAVGTDRQIASEKEREPSSITAEQKKVVAPDPETDKKVDDQLAPKPWLYRNKLDSAY